MRNEIGIMEDNIENMLGSQLHLEVENEGVHDYDAAHLFEVGGMHYLLCLRLSEGREGYLMRLDNLGDGWWNLVDIEDDTEWERVREASAWKEHTEIVHRGK
jgi:hypothetical protein